MLENIGNLTDHHSIEYIPESETISVNYPGALLPVTINIKCDRDALKPQVSIESDSPKGVVLRFLTVGACLVPAIQCVTQDNDGNIYDLSSLKTMEWEIGVSNEKQSRYQIKVCGSLPISPENPCREQAGICSYSFMNNSTRMVEPHNLGIMYKRPVVNEDGDISLEYSHGTKYSDNKGNSCNMSSEIILKCSDRELGPRFEEATACKHTLIWSTTAACPQQKQVSHDCTVREPLFSNLFNLSSLYSTTDYILRGEEENYILNVCGPLISDCSGATCLESGERLTYLEGSLEMNIHSRTCPADTNSTIDARIVFLCNHEIERGAPELVVERDCELEIEWKTSLACPPHQEVQCSLPTMDGVIDLSSLSLPHQNYQVESDTGEIFLLNVCRSLVHNNQSRCPYQAAACLLNSEDTIDANIGEVDSSLHLDEDGNPILTYTLGSLCKDPESRLGHTQTSIKFLCDPERFDSEPEFLEVFDCHYSFQWINAAACPVQTSMGNCSVTSPQSGFTFDLSSLNKPQGWRWTDTGHHMINQLDLNVCGGLPSSICADGGGVCDSNGLNLGQANSNLTYSEEQLFLTYSGGICPGNPGSTAETRIKFICPPR
ncbi:cation-independent mannose-6-phosphate receptor [Eurytemora carolleeae]|uniref:cation-independent mannose-6-phosphate receptor n=1 Tax=Eurytemora carolleeae TaxID=1294199 RepID=UPI000C773BE7|nr:cation-independent mannose-6-phosphate receptor [Eurytemora carolleeae]|eukprot:XP_023345744.1 cation-independent mannose-6-phosphate receptor-like [Eurytemora affinis]